MAIPAFLSESPWWVFVVGEAVVLLISVGVFRGLDDEPTGCLPAFLGLLVGSIGCILIPNLFLVMVFEMLVTLAAFVLLLIFA